MRFTVNDIFELTCDVIQAPNLFSWLNYHTWQLNDRWRIEFIRHNDSMALVFLIRCALSNLLLFSSLEWIQFCRFVCSINIYTLALDFVEYIYWLNYTKDFEGIEFLFKLSQFETNEPPNPSVAISRNMERRIYRQKHERC